MTFCLLAATASAKWDEAASQDLEKQIQLNDKLIPDVSNLLKVVEKCADGVAYATNDLKVNAERVHVLLEEMHTTMHKFEEDVEKNPEKDAEKHAQVMQKVHQSMGIYQPLQMPVRVCTTGVPKTKGDCKAFQTDLKMGLASVQKFQKNARSQKHHTVDELLKLTSKNVVTQETARRLIISMKEYGYAENDAKCSAQTLLNAMSVSQKEDKYDGHMSKRANDAVAEMEQCVQDKRQQLDAAEKAAIEKKVDAVLAEEMEAVHKNGDQMAEGMGHMMKLMQDKRYAEDIKKLQDAVMGSGQGGMPDMSKMQDIMASMKDTDLMKELQKVMGGGEL